MVSNAVSLDKSYSSVLIIDDNPDDRKLTRIALKDGAQEVGAICEVFLAENLQQGLEFLQGCDNRSADAILLDPALPDTTGFEAIVTLTSVSTEIPVIVISRNDDWSSAAEAFKFGAADYIEKNDIRPRSLWRSVGCCLERKKLEAVLVSQAITDPLTGLKNRRAFFDALEHFMEQARRSGLLFGVFIIDIDGFKQINDSLGHHVGDELLKLIGENVSDALRQTDTIARLGGDEFAIIAPNLKSPSGAMEIANKVISTIGDITTDDGQIHEISASLGVTIYPTDDVDIDVLYSHADTAMYKAKRSNTSNVCFYDEHLHQETKKRHDLKLAIDSEITMSNFFLDYQPIVDGKSHRVIGAEGLARWKDVTDTVIMPSEFIPIAEEDGWISKLGMSLIDQACAFIAQSLNAGAPVVPISINVSPIQCRDTTFPSVITGMIHKHGIDSGYLNIEITESAYMQNIEIARKSLCILREAGVGIHIDDFGTGYSSLSILKELPFDHLKIDRSFVSKITADLDTRRIMETIADLAEKLRFRTVAEGVETPEQAHLLRDIGIDYLQGYHFSRPISGPLLINKLTAGATFTSTNSRFLATG